MARLVNPNFKHLVKSKDTYTGAILEGSSRSGKTISSIDFIILLCVRYETNSVINIVRDTYNSFKTTIYLDFDKRLHDFGIESPFDSSKEVASFKLFGNQINFIGADKPSKFEGAGADYWYFNEMLDIEQMMFNLAEQRCRKFWWGDYNPKFSEHWVYNAILKRPDVAYMHSTVFDNPFVSDTEKKKLLSYEPTPENIQNGTADAYMWTVYGLGKRCAPEGLIFQNITWIDELPEEYESKAFGMDYGFTNDPTALVEVRKKDKNIYAKLHIYQPIDDSDLLYDAINEIVKKDIVIADSSDTNTGGRKMSVDLCVKGLRVAAVKKSGNSIEYGISVLKGYKIHIVRNKKALIEAENYRYKVVQGIKTNIPEDKYNHFWDAFRYCVMTMYRF